jgi:hypothetical protein
MANTPDRLALCVLLAGDHAGGVLLYKILYWAKYAKIVLPEAEGTWIANTHEFWRQNTVMTKRQCERAFAELAARALIEKRQWWFGGRNILHTRPSALTRDFLDAAKSWEAAKELLPYFHVTTENGKPGLPNLGLSNGDAISGGPSTPKLATPKDMKYKQHSVGMKKEDKLPGATSASPPSAPETLSNLETEFSGENIYADTSIKSTSLKDLAAKWGQLSGVQMTFKDFGFLAEARETLAEFGVSENSMAIVEFILINWVKFVKEAVPYSQGEFAGAVAYLPAVRPITKANVGDDTLTSLTVGVQLGNTP